MNVNWVCSIVIVTRRTILTEKVSSIELQASLNVGFELRGLGITIDGLQRAELYPVWKLSSICCEGASP